MTFPAEMRVGSLEVLGALAVFAAVVGRRRFMPSPRIAQDVRAHLSINGRPFELDVAEGHPPRTIGRSAQADVPLSDPEASRRHAALQVAGGTLYVTDLSSRNGTFLNGKRLGSEGIELKIGDHVDVGNTRIELLEVQALP